MQKTTPKNNEYSKNEAVLKILGKKFKIEKKVPETTFQPNYRFSMQKMIKTNNVYSLFKIITYGKKLQLRK